MAVLHVGFLVLQTFLWTKPQGRKIFGTSEEEAEQTKLLAANQGVYMNATIKSGTNDWHGSVYTDWQDDSFQSTNVDQDLLDRGLAGGAGFSRFNEFSGDLGGPIVRDKLWFYFAMMDQYSGKLEPGFLY